MTLKFMKSSGADRVFKTVCGLCALLVILLSVMLFIQLLWGSRTAWAQFGLGFIFGTEWNPVENHYGALPAITGTLLTTVIALILAVPGAFAVAMYLVDAPKAIGNVLSHALDLLAAIPSVIYGMWGLFVIVPLMQQHVQPFLVDTLKLGKIPFFGAEYNGFGFLTAGVILGLMVLPFISALMRNVFMMTPGVLRESAYGLGCTRWEVTWDIVMRYGIRGMLGAIFVGLGRALGETMAVLFVIGNVIVMPESLNAGGTTIAATLANNFGEADGTLRSVLFALGLILLIMSLGIQVLAQYYLNATGAKRGEK